MLKKIVLNLSSEVIKSQSVQTFLQHTEQSGIETSPYAADSPLPFSPEDSLIITDTASGISSARTANLPCIGFAPPGHSEDFSGAYALFEDFASIDMGYLCRTHAHAMGYPAEILTTDRLTVRELSEKDFPKLYAMCTAPETAPFMDEKLSDFIDFARRKKRRRDGAAGAASAIWSRRGERRDWRKRRRRRQRRPKSPRSRTFPAPCPWEWPRCRMRWRRRM